ncbi:MAG: TonB-dependent receptor plug domain-containing protein, partial [Proteobacteria bacterium]|nr:TonB-dependent receptor plug domain-containing protein [Pseudomonadota bacterium]
MCGRRVRAKLSACWLVLATWLVISDGVRAQSYEAVATTGHRVGDSFRNKVGVGRREAEESASGTVGEILERAPGVLVQRTSSSSGAPIVRGLTGHRVLLMLDGMRLNDALMRVGGNA